MALGIIRLEEAIRSFIEGLEGAVGERYTDTRRAYMNGINLQSFDFSGAFIQSLFITLINSSLILPLSSLGM